MSKPIVAAKKYFELGWDVIPLHPRSKRPMLKGWTELEVSPQSIEKWWTESPEANVGVRTGAGSGIIALDIDGGYQLDPKQCPIPITPKASTPSGGSHYIFEHPGFPVVGTVRILGNAGSGVDIRGDGQQIAAAPSILDNGQYRWIINPLEVKPAKCPDWVLELLQRRGEAPKVPITHVVGGVPEGERNSAAARMAGKLLRSWGAGEAKRLLSAWNAQNVPPLPDEELDSVFNSILARDSRKPGRDIAAEIERAVVATMLEWPDHGLLRARELQLKPTDFYSPVLQHVFGAMLALDAEGKTPDLLTLTDYLETRGLMDLGLSAAKLVEIKAGAESKATLDQHIEIVLKSALLREVDTLGDDISSLAQRKDLDLPKLTMELEARILPVRARMNTSTSLTSLDEQVESVMEYMTEIREGSSIVCTGFSEIDKKIRGLRHGSYNLLIGRPSHGKTMVANNIAFSAMRRGERVFYISLELDSEELVARWVQRAGGLRAGQLRSREPHESAAVAEATGKVMGYRDNVFFYRGSTALPDLLAAIQKAVMHKSVKLVVLENLDLISLDRVEKVNDKIREASLQLKRLVRELKGKGYPFALLLLSQANRQTGVNEDKFPMPDNVANSDQPMRDADMVFSILNADKAEDAEHAGMLGIKCIKNNRGPAFFEPVWLKCDEERQTLTDAGWPGGTNG